MTSRNIYQRFYYSCSCCAVVDLLLGGFCSNPVTTMNHHYNAGGSVQSYQPSHIQYHHHQPTSTRLQPQLPQCQANGCHKPVHYDPGLLEGLQEFAYCSPQCRDRDLLAVEKINLTVAAAEKRSPSSTALQKQSSHEYSSRSTGSSSFPAVGRVLGGRDSSGVSNAMHSSSSTPAGGGRSFGASLISGGDECELFLLLPHSLAFIFDVTNLSDTSNNKAKERQTSVLSVTKLKYEPFGVLLRKTPYTSDKTYGVGEE